MFPLQLLLNEILDMVEEVAGQRSGAVRDAESQQLV